MGLSGQLQLPRQWRLIRDFVLEPVSGPVGDDKPLLLHRSETIRRPYDCSFRRRLRYNFTAACARSNYVMFSNSSLSSS